METFDNIDIQEVPLGTPLFRRKAEGFLQANGLDLETVDSYYGIWDDDGELLAGGGLYRGVIRCIAVSERARSLGLAAPLVSRLIAEASERGYANVKVFTKPENAAIFESLGFREIGRAPKAILMENGRGIEDYKKALSGFRRPGKTGVAVMNANPFTLGHKYLLERAAASLDHLLVIPVQEDLSAFTYEERLGMLRRGTAGIPGVEVLEGSDYAISAATFPSYFLKRADVVAENQMLLDADIFSRHIAPALGATVRVVGEEPRDAATARYNETLKALLPARGIEVLELPRYALDGEPLSASDVRKALDNKDLSKAWRLTPPETHPYLLAFLAAKALTAELDTPLKPGLVSPGDSGAHTDMDEALMRRSIAALRRGLVRHCPESCPSPAEVIVFGKAVEADILAATGGVNTHRGAVFALGLAFLAALNLDGNVRTDALQAEIRSLAEGIAPGEGSHGAEAVRRYGAKGALQMAREGYSLLFQDWLPFFRSLEGDPWQKQKTLLRIMSALDDTCVLHRAGPGRASALKAEASALEADFSEEGLRRLCDRCRADGVSPGGCADMLSLTILTDYLLSNNT